MDFGPATYGLGLLAGLLSTLSPCVLPLLPILLSSATASHPRAPLALAAGLALSYALIGTLMAGSGVALGLDARLFRTVGAVLLGGLGLVLLSATLQQRFASATAGIGQAGLGFITARPLAGLGGQFMLGAALGVVWSPCVGPTLGAAIVLASQGAHLPQVAALMGVFGLGAALPVLGLAGLSRQAPPTWRARLAQTGRAGKTVLGGVLLGLSVLMLSGADKALETWLVELSPAWLTALTTRF